jgi:transcriptional regulator with XRE-family HTH domain
MTEIQRVKKVIKWLIYQGIAENESELSGKMGYTKSSFSQIINGKVNLSGKFIDKLCEWDPILDSEWVKSGKGSIFLSKDPIPVKEVVVEKIDEINTVDIERSSGKVIEKGSEVTLLNRLLNEKERVIREKERVIREKDKTIEEKERVILLLDNIIEEKDKLIKDNEIRFKQIAIEEIPSDRLRKYPEYFDFDKIKEISEKNPYASSELYY